MENAKKEFILNSQFPSHLNGCVTKKRGRGIPPHNADLFLPEYSFHISQSLGCLDVQIPDRQRLIGSPAPQALRRVNEKHRQLKKVRDETKTAWF